MGTVAPCFRSILTHRLDSVVVRGRIMSRGSGSLMSLTISGTKDDLGRTPPRMKIDLLMVVGFLGKRAVSNPTVLPDPMTHSLEDETC